MAGFANFATIIAARDAGKTIRLDFLKTGGSAITGDTWNRLWNRNTLPAAEGEPASTPGAAYTDAGLFYTNTSTDRKYVTKFGLSHTVAGQGTLMLYDRLVGVGSITLVGTGNKTVSSAALTRYTDGVGVRAMLEVTNAMTGGATFTMNSYTNQAGTSGRNSTSAVAIPSGTVNHSTYMIPLLSGDTGVRAVSTINLSAAASVGTANIVLIKPLLYLPFVSNNPPTEIDPILELNAFVRVYDGASLGMAIIENSGSGSTYGGYIEMVYG